MIHARGLARSFRTRRGTVDAVSGVDIDVSPGELVGFLGPNGAGKSTTLRMLTTLIDPTAGTATVAGHDLLTEPVAVRRKIGYVGQNGGAGPDCRVGEELVLQGRLYGLSAADAARRAAELIHDLDLTGLDTRRAGSSPRAPRTRSSAASPATSSSSAPPTRPAPHSSWSAWAPS